MSINKEIVPFSYIIEYKDSDPLHLLYQIICYLELTKKDDMEFTISEVNLHTTTRKEGKALPLIEDLVESGHIKKIKSVRYVVVVNPWES